MLLSIDERACKCCGQTLPPALDLGIRLTTIQQHIVDHVHRAGKYGIRSNRLLQFLYEDHVDGGPLHAVKAMHVQIHNLNKRLAPIGRKVVNKGAHGGERGFGTYFIVEVSGDAADKRREDNSHDRRKRQADDPDRPVGKVRQVAGQTRVHAADRACR